MHHPAVPLHHRTYMDNLSTRTMYVVSFIHLDFTTTALIMVTLVLGHIYYIWHERASTVDPLLLDWVPIAVEGIVV